MPRRFVGSSRLSRARKISEKSVVDFKIVSEVPLKVYGLIQGSARSPYVVAIDTERKVVAHKCPDVRSNRWCKHIGKVLLKLSSTSLDHLAVAKVGLKLTTSMAKIDEMLSELKSTAIMSEPTSEEVTLEEHLLSLSKMEGISRDAKVVTTFLDRLDDELDVSNPTLQLLTMQRIVDVYDRNKNQFLTELLIEALEPYLEDVLFYLERRFWTTSTLRRLEYAWLIRNVSRRIRPRTWETSIQPPSDVSLVEMIDAEIVLSVLEGNEPDMSKVRFLEDEQVSRELYDSRFERLAQRVRLSGTPVESVKNWIYARSKRFSADIFYTERMDDLLNYILAVNGETPRYTVKVSQRYPTTYLKVKLIEENPGLKFVIDRIKQSERDYITYDEVQRHQHFFTSLESGDFSTEWTERLRERVPDSVLDIDGFIVQWDICVNGVYPQFLHNLMDDGRMVIDQSSVLYSQIQPFDLTLCRTGTKYGADGTQIVMPEVILMPDQVIDLVLSGVQVYSEVLPWDVLSKYAQTGYIESGEIAVALKQCEDYMFAFGSYELRDALEEISLLGRQGVSEELYTDIYEKIKNSTGRLNTTTRPLVRKLIIGEGGPLKLLMEAVSYNEKDQLKVTINTIKKSPTLKRFRETIVDLVVKEIVLDVSNVVNLSQLEGLEDLGPYSDIIRKLADKFKGSFHALKRFISEKDQTRETVRTSVIGILLSQELQIPSKGVLTEEESEALKIRVGKLEPFFS